MAAALTTALCWLRNDLRIDDNEVLRTALADHARVAVVYYLDHRLFAKLPRPEIRKTGPYRVAFLLQSLHQLRRSLREIGGDLIVRQGNDPAAALAELAQCIGASAMYAQAEVGTEERTDERALAAALPESCELRLLWGKTLYDPDQLPFDPDDIPEPYRKFRRAVEKLPVREPLDPPERIGGLPEAITEAGAIPSLPDLGYPEVEPAYPGGERAALERLRYYLFDSHLIQDYRKTRNLSLGADYSSKFSAYLAMGCLSPRRIHAEVTRYGEEYKPYGGRSLLFEMRWRDFFIYLGRKHGARIFRPGGYRDREHDWVQDEELFASWCAGHTGVPFVDAHMRELNATGFMSNRGRVNCASFLTRDYHIDWRWGAAWFENRLIDYEVCANWLNWHTQALEIYYTSAPWQGLKYDGKGEYVTTWLPELTSLPAPLLHAPWKMEEEDMLPKGFELGRDYPRPRVHNSKWDWAWGRLKTGDASSPRRKKRKSKN